MSLIDEIKSAIYDLSHKNLELFRAWFYEYGAMFGTQNWRKTFRPGN